MSTGKKEIDVQALLDRIFEIKDALYKAGKTGSSWSELGTAAQVLATCESVAIDALERLESLQKLIGHIDLMSKCLEDSLGESSVEQSNLKACKYFSNSIRELVANCPLRLMEPIEEIIKKNSRYVTYKNPKTLDL